MEVGRNEVMGIGVGIYMGADGIVRVVGRGDIENIVCTLRELPALIFRNWVHFKQIYV